MLELGEAEIYGDVSLQEMLADVKAYAGRDTFFRAAGLIGRARSEGAGKFTWDFAKILYETFFGATEVDSIDLNGTGRAIKLDLNLATAWETPAYGVVFNTGTAEHVFRIGRVLEFVHGSAKPGGLMIHCFPFSGLVDHGFYNINPTLIYDLARANAYKILHLTLSTIGGPLHWLDPATGRDDLRKMANAGTLPQNAWLHVVYRKGDDGHFRIPAQAIYSQAPDPKIYADWMASR